jgi:hypothetical protein
VVLARIERELSDTFVNFLKMFFQLSQMVFALNFPKLNAKSVERAARIHSAAGLQIQRSGDRKAFILYIKIVSIEIILSA